MDPETLATGRDLALILLIIEAAIIALPLVIIPILILRYLPRIRAPIRPNLRRVRQGTLQVERVTKVVMGMAVQPFLWAAATGAALRRGLEYLARRR
jgi:hypothetical protein